MCYFNFAHAGLKVDLEDSSFVSNRDWDLMYLYELFKEDFFDFGNMSVQDRELSDEELVSAVEVVENDRNCEKYSPIVEDITMDDLELSAAVEKIKQE